MELRPFSQRLLVWLILLAVLVWSGVHALGAFLFEPQGGNVEEARAWGSLRGLVVMATALAFVAFWAIMLKVRQRAIQRETEHDVE